MSSLTLRTLVTEADHESGPMITATAVVTRMLTLLELRGLAQQLGGMLCVRG